MEKDLQCLAGYDAGRYSTQLLTTQEAAAEHEPAGASRTTHQQLQATGDGSRSTEGMRAGRGAVQCGNTAGQRRKPRFFNRMHTGFEWNKYNQTH